ncbi:MAG: hypothetical protein KJ600_04060 [Nanoarchaeota archaeon]|nr:hypothetical protein [Nanoarchaeota archaeon]MBU1103702.1 hypothetical protein [Nanoarchaeota archaeon]
MIQAFNLLSAIITIGIFVISAFPLHKAVKIFKGRAKFHKTLFVVITSSIVISLINAVFTGWAGASAFIFLIWIYRKAFRLKWYKAIMVWALHLAFIIASSIIIELILNTVSGISVFFGNSF